MIKRLNKFILGIRLRPTVATLLGGSAGLSLTATILPMAIEAFGVTDSFSARIDIAGFAVYAFMLWAVGGWAAQKVGSALGGGIILGLVGAISAAIITRLALGAGTDLLLLCGAAGLAYGAVGGLLIASALREPATPKTPKPGK